MALLREPKSDLVVFPRLLAGLCVQLKHRKSPSSPTSGEQGCETPATPTAGAAPKYGPVTSEQVFLVLKDKVKKFKNHNCQ